MMARFKICADEDCLKTFRPYSSIEKYCSYQCFNKNKKPSKPKAKAKPINSKSKARKELDKIYLKLRKIYLRRPENKYCAVYKDKFATEVHHKAGRTGKLYLYVPYWLPVSSEGHTWIHNNPKKAYKKGYSIKSTTVKI